MAPRRMFTYENLVLLILGLAFGFAFFDRTAGSVLMPFIAPELHLNNTQIGLAGSGLAITWALGAYVIGRWSDATGRRKPFLLAFLVIFSLCSIISGLATSFPVLLGARMVMGLVEGPFLPVCLAIMAAESSPNRIGLNAGLMQNFLSSLLGQSLAPLLLIPLADAEGWRSAFYLAGVPGLLAAVAVYLWVREPPKPVRVLAASDEARPGLFDMLKLRNIWLCCAIAMFMVGWLIIGLTFLPVFFTLYRGMTPGDMSHIMTALGICTALSAFIVPGLSDRIGRKPVMIVFCLAGAISPLAALYFNGSLTALVAIMMVGWLATGAFPMFMGVVPGETIPRHVAATAMGLVVCCGEVVGGFGIVTAAGSLADYSSLAVPILMQAGCALAGGALSFLLIETAPAVVARRVQPAGLGKVAQES